MERSRFADLDPLSSSSQLILVTLPKLADGMFRHKRL